MVRPTLKSVVEPIEIAAALGCGACSPNFVTTNAREQRESSSSVIVVARAMTCDEPGGDRNEVNRVRE